MSDRPDDPTWTAATWEGARRAMLRRALCLTVRERLEALDALARTSERLLEIGELAREQNSRPDERG